jgi:hypothetical protein
MCDTGWTDPIISSVRWRTYAVWTGPGVLLIFALHETQWLPGSQRKTATPEEMQRR